ncbi:hypothetical protein [Stakelama tenebrarum]|uniref:Uncharacterized protein n=1 Tax=Stakelama tenebrarum TaxID=2711215 RepID=A0A6G6Y7Q5_9SPHN|nr:hypothetical protein [Sphingosinithalassobacter tenebrarum]QIG80974.1 hypothetical protein G5C33_15040 [Sphingosinithalassobacter tenebrarum]
MNNIQFAVASLAFVSLAGCSQHEPTEVTLYRNSPFLIGARIHWSTFDAVEDDPNYNANNCAMAARLLNANMTASAKAEGKARDPSIGFWCELGRYEQEGPVPDSFFAAYPTDVN